MTLLFQELRGPFRVVLMRVSCQSRFFVRRHRTKSHSDIVLLPSCGLHGATQGRLGALLRPCRKWHLIEKNNINRHLFPSIISRSFKVVLTIVSCQGAFFVRRHRSRATSTIVSCPFWCQHGPFGSPLGTVRKKSNCATSSNGSPLFLHWRETHVNIVLTCVSRKKLIFVRRHLLKATSKTACRATSGPS